MKKYVVVSQGVKIAEFENKAEALAYVRIENENFYNYKQHCLDAHEPYADNELLLYEEEVCERVDTE